MTGLPEFDVSDQAGLTDALDEVGAAIIHNLVDDDGVQHLNGQINHLVDAFQFTTRGSEIYDEFAGHKTVRLEKMVRNGPDSAALIEHPDVLRACDHILAPKCSNFILSTAELIEIGPDETVQMPHRDQDVWTEVATVGEAILASCIIALTPFTKENGGTQVTPGSHKWAADRKPKPDEILYCEMPAGSGLMFRGDTLHGGGANQTEQRRRCLATSYIVGWLRPFENAQLGTPLEIVRTLPRAMQDLLGYTLYKGNLGDFAQFGYVDYDDPRRLLDKDT